MCGVIGFYSKKENKEDLSLFKEIMIQSQIRGKHASGISFIEEGELKTIKEPIPSSEFVKKGFLEGKSSPIIGHCRYSTSDIEFNQPLMSEDISIVHNGVITQSSPDKWLKEFGEKCETRNDSELILRKMISGDDPFYVLPGSIASIVLISTGELMFFRNGERPLWFIQYKGSFFIASTSDIIKRAFRKVIKEEVEPEECLAGYLYLVEDDSVYKQESKVCKDSQVKLECANFYKKIEI